MILGKYLFTVKFQEEGVCLEEKKFDNLEDANNYAYFELFKEKFDEKEGHLWEQTFDNIGAALFLWFIGKNHYKICSEKSLSQIDDVHFLLDELRKSQAKEIALRLQKRRMPAKIIAEIVEYDLATVKGWLK